MNSHSAILKAKENKETLLIITTHMNINGFYLNSDLITKKSPLKVPFNLHTRAALDPENFESTRVAIAKEIMRTRLQTVRR
jgi:hypothetical protein